MDSVNIVPNCGKLVVRSSKVIRMSRKQVQMNVSHTGGFLGLLAGLAAKALPMLIKGVATGLASGAVNKAISGSGDGLYFDYTSNPDNVSESIL